MTAKPVSARADARRLPPLPDPPKLDMQQVTHFVLPGVMSTVGEHLGAQLPGSTTLVSGNGHQCSTQPVIPCCTYPDMLIAINVDQEDIIITNGYVIGDVGKPLVWCWKWPSTPRAAGITSKRGRSTRVSASQNSGVSTTPGAAITMPP